MDEKKTEGSEVVAAMAQARAARDQCRAAGVKCFVKQLGSSPRQWLTAGPHDPFHLRDRAGADPAEWPKDLRVQEIPA